MPPPFMFVNRKTSGLKPFAFRPMARQRPDGAGMAAGGGQMQLLRQNIPVQAQAPAQQQESRQTRVEQSSISMQEGTRAQRSSVGLFRLTYAVVVLAVLKDLAILHQQQKEAQQQLEEAQRLKQKRQAELDKLQAHLAKLKFSNGQHQAELQRAHDAVTKSQRAVTAIRQKADKGGDDLRLFEK